MSGVMLSLLASAGGAPVNKWDIEYLQYNSPEFTNYSYEALNNYNETFRGLSSETLYSSMDSSTTFVGWNKTGTRLYFKGGSTDRFTTVTLSGTVVPFHPGAENTTVTVANTSWSNTTFQFGNYISEDESFVLVSTTNKIITKYVMSTPGDITTLNNAVPYNITLTDASISSTGTPWMSSDGTAMFVYVKTASSVSTGVWKFDLITPFNPQTITSHTPSQILSLTALGAPAGGTSTAIQFSPLGDILIVGKYHFFSLSTPWDLSSATYNSSKSATSYTTDRWWWMPDGKGHVYVNSSNLLSVGSGSLEVKDTGVDIGGFQWEPGGTKFFILDDADQKIIEYTVDNAFDISQARDTYTTPAYSTVSSSNIVRGPVFNPGGTKLYYVERESSTVSRYYEYNLSSAWNVNGMSLVGSQTVTYASSTTPQDISFNNDGTKLFISTSDAIIEHNLSVAYDISTISYNSTTNLQSVITGLSGTFNSAYGFTFWKAGEKMYIFARTPQDGIYQCSLSTPYEPSSATFEKLYHYIFRNTNGGEIIRFNSAGTKMFGAVSGYYFLNQYIIT